MDHFRKCLEPVEKVLRDSKIDNLYGEEYHDKDYTSFLNVSSLKLGETYHDMIERTSNFIINKIINTSKQYLRKMQ